MESNNLTTRTYTAPTCALIVSTKSEPRDRHSTVPMEFILHLEDPDRSETDRITLHGQAQQLDRLQQVIDKYISELVAQFPLPGVKRIVAIDEPAPAGLEDRNVPTAEPAADNPSSARLHPQLDPRAARSGILKNLPGLQKDNSSAPPPASTSDDRSIIDKLLGRRPKPDPYASIARSIGSVGRVTPTSSHQSATNHPYLTGVGDDSAGGEVRQRSLDHQLHLGNLATPASGETIVLSAIQLFDLASVLEEYATEKSAAGPQTPTTGVDRFSIPVNSEQPIDLEAVVSRSRLPNLPLIPSDPDENPIYYRTRRPRSSWMSALPWVVGATVAMVGGIFIVDPNFKPFQDIAGMMKSPSLGGAKKPTPVKPVGELAQAPTTATTTTTPTGTLPTPWQQQPVQPPQVTKPIDSSTNVAQTPSKIGIAPLPDAIATQPGQAIPNSLGTPTGTTQQSAASILSTNGVPSATGVAPNPLNATQPPSATTTTTTSTVKTPNPASKAKTPAQKTTASAQLPTDLTTPGKLSVSKQPMPIPPSNAPAIVNPPFKAVPFDPPTQVPDRIDPATRTPAPKKSATQAAKPTPSAVLTPSSNSEPFTPVPRNPNLIDPNQPNSSATTEPQNSPVVPNKPLQSNAGGIEPEVPLLQESRRYIQGKWKTGNNQPNSLQYVVQVNGKSGVVRSVDPQGEAASAYLRETKFIKPGQKLVSPAAVGGSDQKIRVLLQPDGIVETFIEP